MTLIVTLRIFCKKKIICAKKMTILPLLMVPGNTGTFSRYGILVFKIKMICVKKMTRLPPLTVPENASLSILVFKLR
jgi:hypothetical protein